MKLLIFGKNGQVGWELQRSLAPLGEVIALGQNEANLCGDLSNLEGLRATLQRVAPDVIVNAAAHTAVDRAESEPDLAYRINAEAPSVMAEEAQRLGALLVHYSTDYVYEGSGERFWQESDAPAPLNLYGKSKLAGDQAIMASGCRHLIFRTSWVYAARGNNFAKTMLGLARTRNALSVVSDQVGAPTGAELIADVTAQAIYQALLDPQKQGLYHLVASGSTSWFDYAREVFSVARELGETLQLSDDAVTPIASSEYPKPAQRPLNSRLCTQKLTNTFQLTLPDWKVGVARMLRETLEPLSQ
ncbi:dTDP-4-keto-L-rhamnose reductase [gamma proteobacterium HdN1]|nr:dTDP-4-keto-L-rhamnose reductase [gamma proteobacterium HdN1]